MGVRVRFEGGEVHGLEELGHELHGLVRTIFAPDQGNGQILGPVEQGTEERVGAHDAALPDRLHLLHGIDLDGGDVGEDGVFPHEGTDGLDGLEEGCRRHADDDDGGLFQVLSHGLPVEGPAEACHAESGKPAFVHEHGAHAAAGRDHGNAAGLGKDSGGDR